MRCHTLSVDDRATRVVAFSRAGEVSTDAGGGGLTAGVGAGGVGLIQFRCTSLTSGT
jgi:hypothetical protein